jgi:hypothetical protein
MPSFKNRAKAWSRIWHANVGIATAITLGAIALSCPFIAHKGDFAFGKALMEIHYGKFLPKDWQWLWIDVQGAALLFLIISGVMIHHRAVKKAAVRAADDPTAPGSSVTILWEGGRPEAEAGARRLAKAAEDLGMRAFATDNRKYSPNRLTQERWLVCVLAGKNGETLLHLNGEKLPRLEFAVVATDEDATSRCTILSNGLTERGAKPFVSAGRIAADIDQEMVSHLQRFVKVPKTAAAGAAPAVA